MIPPKFFEHTSDFEKMPVRKPVEGTITGFDWLSLRGVISKMMPPKFF